MISILTIHFLKSGCLHMGAVVFFGILIDLTVNDFVKGRGGVKIFLLRDELLKAVEWWLNGVRKPSISDRRPSITGERWGRVQEMLRSIFLKRGPFMVWNLNWCCYLKWIDVSLARDT
ncbi:hypothetical protein [uncultured Gimesia sp.]|uniref:hypothetical protein n=1 Tax=uncultured Gimesia sp. TaxID=1678688 RepID=UPI002608096D|nr:hypothetical protein [uncultured Gimesia sp.]